MNNYNENETSREKVGPIYTNVKQKLQMKNEKVLANNK